ncbi:MULTISPECIES: glycosyltransferase family 2 protein [unclassified Coleofasciculus]|uniref:glycosyltransferase family 2 protein n=1 Tax=unclassified Coleofasciculus TaxID=2692782 RepID=UPI001882406F|nr:MULTISPECIES: glycosyltransferase family 2 protein [unclassified Coleofasciculus]MBE9125261.1 glycosyltransferase family 2 protein [Coleofasciculus sp. LEGE 07081]MBE9147042.1 glycosyltransferase family 2 protein [Coleofasciculus sp. LEGE 07092]
MIYLLTVNYYSTYLIARLIKSIPATQDIPHQIIVVNNSADDKKLKNIHTKSLQILNAETNLGFGNACNLGLNWIYDRNPNAIVWIINPDTYLPENTLEKVPSLFNVHPELSIIGTLICTLAGDIWFAGGHFIPQLGAILSTDLLSSHPEATYIPCDWVSGCSLLLNLHHFQTCPQFDPAYFLYYEDFDFCRRYAMEGHQIAITSQLAVIHQPSSITNRNITQKFKHSTYSYLLTLERYTSQAVLFLRFWRLFLHALILLMIKPQTALGKLAGISSYLRRAI